MKLLVVSDSHGAESFLRNILMKNRNCDAFIHLGDGSDDMYSLTEYTAGKPVYTVRGNCDWYSNEPEHVITDFGGVRFFACHGHRYGVKNGLGSARYAAMEAEAAVCLYGHTHIQRLEDGDDGIRFVNPGSAMKGEYAVIEITDGGTDVRLCSPLTRGGL